jgi:colicin import membrane protein
VTTPSFPPRNEPNLFWLLAISLALHMLVFVLFSGVLSGGKQHERRPVYYVDLTKMPVLNPQAGRPDGGPAPKAKAAAKPTAPAQVSQPTPQPAPEPKPSESKPTQVASKPTTPQPTATPQPTSTKPGLKPAKQDAKPSDSAPSGGYQSVQEKMAAMRQSQQRAQELAALKGKIAALSGDDTSGSGSGAPLGMPDGTGDEIGVDQQTWLQAFYKENWSLSKYQVTRRDLQATVQVTYSADGTLTNYRFIDSSGDAAFDDSLKKTILKTKTLPFKPGRTLQFDVVFNLKDLMD